MVELTAGMIAEEIEKWAPKIYAEPYDNPGLILGRSNKQVKKIVMAVDASELVIAQAVAWGADMLIVHHPLPFTPIKTITDEDRIGRQILTLIENHITLYAVHTNGDSAPNGGNDYACHLLGLQNVRAVAAEDEIACLRIGELKESCTLEALGSLVKEAYQLPHVKVYDSRKKEVKKVAVCIGSGMDFAPLAIKEGADVLITGDISYHKADAALASGLSLVDATHFLTDRLAVKNLAQKLEKFLLESEMEVQVALAKEKELFQVI